MEGLFIPGKELPKLRTVYAFMTTHYTMAALLGAMFKSVLGLSLVNYTLESGEFAEAIGNAKEKEVFQPKCVIFFLEKADEVKLVQVYSVCKELQRTYTGVPVIILHDELDGLNPFMELSGVYPIDTTNEEDSIFSKVLRIIQA